MFAVKGFGFLFPLSFSKTMQERKPLQANASAKKQVKSKIDIAKSEKPALSKKEQERLNQALMDAAFNGKNTTIMRLIKAGADIAAKNRHGKTALHHAAWKMPVQTCALLIEQYAKAGGDIRKLITAKDSDGWMALHLATTNKNTKTAQFLKSIESLANILDKEESNAFYSSFAECTSG